MIVLFIYLIFGLFLAHRFLEGSYIDQGYIRWRDVYDAYEILVFWGSYLLFGIGYYIYQYYSKQGSEKYEK